MDLTRCALSCRCGSGQTLTENKHSKQTVWALRREDVGSGLNLGLVGSCEENCEKKLYHYARHNLKEQVEREKKN